MNCEGVEISLEILGALHKYLRRTFVRNLKSEKYAILGSKNKICPDAAAQVAFFAIYWDKKTLLTINIDIVFLAIYNSFIRSKKSENLFSFSASASRDSPMVKTGGFDLFWLSIRLSNNIGGA